MTNYRSDDSPPCRLPISGAGSLHNYLIGSPALDPMRKKAGLEGINKHLRNRSEEENEMAPAGLSGVQSLYTHTKDVKRSSCSYSGVCTCKVTQ